jgi:hypothetical protein
MVHGAIEMSGTAQRHGCTSLECLSHSNQQLLPRQTGVATAVRNTNLCKA